MPRKKPIAVRKTAGRNKRTVEFTQIHPEPEPEMLPQMPPAVSGPKDGSRALYGALAVAVVLIAVFLVKNGYIIAATVNGRPIFRWQVSRVLYDRYGAQTMEGMITEALIASEADRNDVQVTSADIDEKEKQILSSFGSELTLEDLLKYQGMTKEELDKQVSLQLTVERLVGKDVTVSDAEIANYIATNSANLTATTEAEMKEEARRKISEELVNEKVQPWFQELKNTARILRFP